MRTFAQELEMAKAASEMAGRHSMLEIMFEALRDVSDQVDEGALTDPRAVVFAMKNWIRESMAASIHCGYHASIVDEADMLQAIKDLYVVDEEKARSIIAQIEEGILAETETGQSESHGA